MVKKGGKTPRLLEIIINFIARVVVISLIRMIGKTKNKEMSFFYGFCECI